MVSGVGPFLEARCQGLEMSLGVLGKWQSRAGKDGERPHQRRPTHPPAALMGAREMSIFNKKESGWAQRT